MVDGWWIPRARSGLVVNIQFFAFFYIPDHLFLPSNQFYFGHFYWGGGGRTPNYIPPLLLEYLMLLDQKSQNPGYFVVWDKILPSDMGVISQAMKYNKDPVINQSV